VTILTKLLKCHGIDVAATPERVVVDDRSAAEFTGIRRSRHRDNYRLHPGARLSVTSGTGRTEDCRNRSDDQEDSGDEQEEIRGRTESILASFSLSSACSCSFSS
jgi:hypothetical protein